MSSAPGSPSRKNLNPVIGSRAARELPGGRKGDDNREAKVWTLVDPSGNAIQVLNLRQWCVANAGLFGEEPENAGRIAAGFRNLALAQRGKVKRPAATYKGWSLAGPPRLPDVDVTMQRLPYNVFRRLWSLATRVPFVDDYVWQVGCKPETCAAGALALIHRVVNGDIRAMREYTGMTQPEYAERYGVRLEQLRRWEETPTSITPLTIQLLTYAILMDERQRRANISDDSDAGKTAADVTEEAISCTSD